MTNIEKIRQEIERRKNICEGIFERESDTYYQGKAVAYGELLPFIDSLQQEPIEKDEEMEALIACDIIEATAKRVNIDKQDKDKEEEVKRYYSDNFTYISSDQPTLSILTNVARHFAEWQKERMIKDAKEIITIQGSLTEPEFVKQRVIFLKEG